MKALYFDRDLARILAAQVAGRVSRRAALGRLSPVRYGDVPEPRLPGPRWVKVRTRVCGLCGTDLHVLLMDIDPLAFTSALPGLERKYLGHEVVGEVVDVGEEARDPAPGPDGRAAAGFAPGDRVALRIDYPSCFQMEIDPPCRQCRDGSYGICENAGIRPLPRDVGGGFSPFMVAHRTQLFHVPDHVPRDRDVLLEPTAAAVHAVLKRPPQPGERVLVIGAGSIGLLTLAVVRSVAPRADVHCLVRHAFQGTAAAAMGASVHREGAGVYAALAAATGARLVRAPFRNRILLGGFDIVIDTVGSDRTLSDAFRWTRARGCVVLLGANFRPGKLDYTPVWHQELEVIGVDSHGTEADGRTSFDHAAALLADPAFSVDGLITHRFPMDRYREAIDVFLAKRKTRAIKIVLEHPPAGD